MNPIACTRFQGSFPEGRGTWVGDFVWGDEVDGIRTLYIVLPGTDYPDALQCFRGRDRGIPREWGWDGNEEKPTLRPSILDGVTGWHGYLVAGFLRLEPPS